MRHIKTFNDILALVTLGMIGATLIVLAIVQPDMRREVLVLLGPWGTLVLQFYFRRREPPVGGTGGTP